MKKNSENVTCPVCNDTGEYYNEGSYGWDYGGHIFCECPRGREAEQEYYEYWLNGDI